MVWWGIGGLLALVFVIFVMVQVARNAELEDAPVDDAAAQVP